MEKTVGSVPLVSVIISAYNAEEYIDETLRCVEQQTYSHLEIIVVDDGSTDGTRDIVTAHAVADDRVAMLLQENQYAGVARNNGMDHAHGSYLLFLDADDVFLPGMIELLVKRAQETSSDVVVCGSVGLDVKTGLKCPLGASLQKRNYDEVASGFDLREEMFFFCGGWAWDKLFRADFVRSTGLRFQDTRTSNDAFFVFVSLMLAQVISFVGDDLVMHRVNNSQSLEGSRDKSYGNALDAIARIGLEMERRELKEGFGKSFDNWKLTFLLWNYLTLSDAVRPEFLRRVLDEVVPTMPCEPPCGYYRSDLEERIARLWEVGRESRLALMDDAMRSEILLTDMRDELRVAHERLEDAAREAEALRMERDGLRRELDEVRASTTFRVGRAVMRVPCAIKARIAP